MPDASASPEDEPAPVTAVSEAASEAQPAALPRGEEPEERPPASVHRERDPRGGSLPDGFRTETLMEKRPVFLGLPLTVPLSVSRRPGGVPETAEKS